MMTSDPAQPSGWRVVPVMWTDPDPDRSPGRITCCLCGCHQTRRGPAGLLVQGGALPVGDWAPGGITSLCLVLDHRHIRLPGYLDVCTGCCQLRADGVALAHRPGAPTVQHWPDPTLWWQVARLGPAPGAPPDLPAVGRWPRPTVRVPSLGDLEAWADLGECQATDGCTVGPDGVCPHGHPSWLLRLAMI